MSRRQSCSYRTGSIRIRRFSLRLVVVAVRRLRHCVGQCNAIGFVQSETRHAFKFGFAFSETVPRAITKPTGEMTTFVPIAELIALRAPEDHDVIGPAALFECGLNIGILPNISRKIVPCLNLGGDLSRFAIASALAHCLQLRVLDGPGLVVSARSRLQPFCILPFIVRRLR